MAAASAFAQIMAHSDIGLWGRCSAQPGRHTITHAAWAQWPCLYRVYAPDRRIFIGAPVASKPPWRAPITQGGVLVPAVPGL